MDKDVVNHLSITVANVMGKVIEKYGVSQFGKDPADPTAGQTNRRIVRGAIAALGIGTGLYDAAKGTKIPDYLAYGLTALGSYNAAELALGYENVLGITGKMFPEELQVTQPDITRLRAKIGQLSQELQRARQENTKLKGQVSARTGKMFPEETVKLSPSSTSAAEIRGMNSKQIMEKMGTVM